MGAKLYYSAPEIFYRDCDECKKYIYANGEVLKDEKGNKKIRPESLPVNCTMCKKYDRDTGKPWSGFSPRNEYIFTCYRAASAFGVLPKEGGVNNQDADVLHSMLLLHDIITAHKDIENKEWMLKMAKIGRAV